MPLRAAKDAFLSAAVLDLRLGRHMTEAVADALTARKVPFLFYSGQTLPSHMLAKYPNTRVLAKPMPHNAFVQAILDVAGHRQLIVDRTGKGRPFEQLLSTDVTTQPLSRQWLRPMW